MKTATKLTASVLGIVSLLLLLISGYYYYRLPDRFYVSENNRLVLSSYSEISPRTSKNNKIDLTLFGIIPIKSVTTQVLDTPLLYPGGEPFGIKLISDGVMVIDFESDSCPAIKCGIKCGDIILSVDGKEVTSNAEISKLIRNCNGQTVKVKIRRDGEEKTVTLTPEVADGSYRAGMWVRDSSAGIGTVTFYCQDKTFGGLGHAVCDIDTGDIVPIRDGEASDVIIHDYQKSYDGAPGALLGGFTQKGSIGEIFANEESGIFGQMEDIPKDKTPIPLGYKQEIQKGKAHIYTTINGKTPEKYEISIEEIHLDGKDTKNMVIKITDKDLLSQTGGILQGMSGSPIIQNGKLIGAVTHVFVNDVTMGYGIFAENMLNTAITKSPSNGFEAAA
ncbi:MAG: SpoIVB peptidase [Ruminococcus sp.]|nr:SpoIVB peptidase [Ruminococcus sp.]